MGSNNIVISSIIQYYLNPFFYTHPYYSYAVSLLQTNDIRHTIIQMVLRSRILFLKKNSVKPNQ